MAIPLLASQQYTCRYTQVWHSQPELGMREILFLTDFPTESMEHIVLMFPWSIHGSLTVLGMSTVACNGVFHFGTTSYCPAWTENCSLWLLHENHEDMVLYPLRKHYRSTCPAEKPGQDEMHHHADASGPGGLFFICRRWAVKVISERVQSWVLQKSR